MSKEKRLKMFIKEHKMSLFVIISAIVMAIGLSYAWLQLTLRGNKDLVMNAGSLKLVLDDSIEGGIHLEKAIPVQDEEGLKQDGYTFTIENTGKIDSSYEIYLDDLELDEGQTRMRNDFLKYQLVKDGEEVSLDLLSSIGENPNRLLDKGEIGPNEKYTYTLKLWIDIDATNEVMGTIFKGQIRIEAIQSKNKSLYKQIAKKAVLDNQTSEFVSSSTGIDFSAISSDTNGKGVYTFASTKDDTFPVHYYRGAVTDNNVKFAGFCWKIVRTTETGGVKLIYNGSPDTNGQCTNTTGEATQIGTSRFHINDHSSVHVGYTDSTIKSFIDNWYQNNMTDYIERLEDAIWCNDRSSRVAGNSTYFGAYDRILITHQPSLACANIDDKFTVDAKNGNGLLTYPVALLTADEIMLAGGNYLIDNSSFYLYTNQIWWTLSPSCFDYDIAKGFRVDSFQGDLYYYSVRSADGVRPALSLAPGTKIKSGDGTKNNPFIISR